MRKGDVMRWMLAGWAGLAGAAGGREVPVHREYTKPVVMYDESGERVVRGGGVPDREAWMLVRESKALEGLVGKETLLTLTLGHGGSVMQGGDGMPMAPQMMVEGARREKGESKGNWLVQSLTMPTLGQSASNAAISAMSADGQESGWGWLADEVSAASWDIEQKAELPKPEEPRGSSKSEPSPSSESASSLWGKRDLSDEQAKPGNFERPPEDGVPPIGREGWASGLGASSREAAGWGGAETPVASWSTKGVMDDGGGLSRTRQMMADLTASVRPKAEGLNFTMGGGASGKPGQTEPGMGSGGQSWGRVETGFQAGKSLGVSTWQGGWNASAGGTAGGISSYGPAPAPAWTGGGSPSPVRERTGAAISSGGAYKPAWY